MLLVCFKNPFLSNNFVLPSGSDPKICTEEILGELSDPKILIAPASCSELFNNFVFELISLSYVFVNLKYGKNIPPILINLPTPFGSVET